MPLAQQRRTLGRTGLAVSPVGLGCSGFWGHRRFPEQSAANVVEHALAQGVATTTPVSTPSRGWAASCARC